MVDDEVGGSVVSGDCEPESCSSAVEMLNWVCVAIERLGLTADAERIDDAEALRDAIAVDFTITVLTEPEADTKLVYVVTTFAGLVVCGCNKLRRMDYTVSDVTMTFLPHPYLPSVARLLKD